jgi:potassium-dependent mechanosensitive channel
VATANSASFFSACTYIADANILFMFNLPRFRPLIATGPESHLSRIFVKFCHIFHLAGPIKSKAALWLVFFTLSASIAFSQRDSTKIKTDTLTIVDIDNQPGGKILNRISQDSVQALTREALKRSVQENLLEFEKDKIAASQNKYFSELTIELENAREYLIRSIDSNSLNQEINNIIKWYHIAADGVFTNKGTAQTSRNLAITNNILTEATIRLNARFEETTKYLNRLNHHKQKLDSLLADSILLNIPKDSAAFASFFKKAMRVGSENRKVYPDLKNTINSVQELNTKVQVVQNTLRMKLEEVEQYRKDLSRNALRREFSNIWGPVGYVRPMSEILKTSLDKNIIVMGFYIWNNLTALIVMSLITIGLALFLKYLDRTATNRMGEEWDRDLHQVLSSPWLISMFIMLNVCQFLFKNPPFLFYALGWISSALILSVLFWEKISKAFRIPWVMLVSLFIVSVFVNSILQASRYERVFTMLLAIITLSAALLSIKHLKKRKGNNQFLLIFVVLVIFMESISIILNIFGRYNTAKTALTSGIFNLVVVVLLLWTCHYIHEIIKIIAQVFNLGGSDPAKEKIEVSPQGLLQFPAFLNILLLAGWFILFMRNFYAFTIFTEPFREFMEGERTLGAYTFSIQSIANFFIIMFFAAVLSKVVSFFATDAYDNTGKISKGVGSWLLLIRIAIFSVAMFLAFAAAGIAMDKIAIIFSALSVGIGFGLQTLVNNLVSGLIIAFEKPVNVGDSVDINGQSGIMKSIGFRSSVISTFDGSDVVIPNGDLLNAHLINWTLGDTKRRVEVLVGVAYGTDIEKTKSILMELLVKDERILVVPAPVILVKEFAASSIDFRVLFWIDTTYHFWTSIKSDVIESIDIAFKNANIEIPFAQQDVHIRSIIQPELPGNPADETTGKKIESEK